MDWKIEEDPTVAYLNGRNARVAKQRHMLTKEVTALRQKLVRLKSHVKNRQKAVYGMKEAIESIQFYRDAVENLHLQLVNERLQCLDPLPMPSYGIEELEASLELRRSKVAEKESRIKAIKQKREDLKARKKKYKATINVLREECDALEERASKSLIVISRPIDIVCEYTEPDIPEVEFDEWDFDEEEALQEIVRLEHSNKKRTTLLSKRKRESHSSTSIQRMKMPLPSTKQKLMVPSYEEVPKYALKEAFEASQRVQAMNKSIEDAKQSWEQSKSKIEENWRVKIKKIRNLQDDLGRRQEVLREMMRVSEGMCGLTVPVPSIGWSMRESRRSISEDIDEMEVRAARCNEVQSVLEESRARIAERRRMLKEQAVRVQELSESVVKKKAVVLRLEQDSEERGTALDDLVGRSTLSSRG